VHLRNPLAAEFLDNQFDLAKGANGSVLIGKSMCLSTFLATQWTLEQSPDIALLHLRTWLGPGTVLACIVYVVHELKQVRGSSITGSFHLLCTRPKVSVDASHMQFQVIQLEVAASTWIPRIQFLVFFFSNSWMQYVYNGFVGWCPMLELVLSGCIVWLSCIDIQRTEIYCNLLSSAWFWFATSSPFQKYKICSPDVS
jgi:hypothetical protein